MDELLPRKVHSVFITVSRIQGLKTKVRIFITACISSVLLTLLACLQLCILCCLWCEPVPFLKSLLPVLMFLSSPFLPVFSQKCLFFSVASPACRKQGKILHTVKICSYYLMIVRKVVNSDCFVHKYTSAATSLIPLHCKFFRLWTAGLGPLV